MKLSDEQVRYVADLANLHLTNDEVSRISHDLSEVLTHMEQLNALDTANVEPMAQVLYGGDETAALREDVPHTPLGTEIALANAPLKGSGYFKVPKVIERA